MFGEATNTLISTKLVDDKNQVVQSASQMAMLEDLASTHGNRLGWGRLGISSLGSYGTDPFNISQQLRDAQPQPLLPV